MRLNPGSATGEICLWQFGKRGAIAGYSPLLANRSSTPTSERTSSMSLFTSTPQSWNAMPGVNISQWGQPQSVSISSVFEPTSFECKNTSYWILAGTQPHHSKLGIELHIKMYAATHNHSRNSFDCVSGACFVSEQTLRETKTVT